MKNKEDKPYIVNGERLTRDEYNNLKFDSFLTRVPKGQKAELQAYAAEHGESLNSFVNKAIAEKIDRDKKPPSE